MNREEVKVLLPVMIAFAEGKTIECQSFHNEPWLQTSNPLWGAGLVRVKTEPHLRWLNIYPADPGDYGAGHMLHDTKPDADLHDHTSSHQRIACIPIEFIEGQGLKPEKTVRWLNFLATQVGSTHEGGSYGLVRSFLSEDIAKREAALSPDTYLAIAVRVEYEINVQ